jgi:hypothetical protein
VLFVVIYNILKHNEHTHTDCQVWKIMQKPPITLAQQKKPKRLHLQRHQGFQFSSIYTGQQNADGSHQFKLVDHNILMSVKPISLKHTVIAFVSNKITMSVQKIGICILGSV